MTRFELLEAIATLAIMLRSREWELLRMLKPRSAFDRLTLTQRLLDHALDDLMRRGTE